MFLLQSRNVYASRVGNRLSFINKNHSRQRHFWKNMECKILRPPHEVRGMTNLRKEAFDKEIQVPRLRIPASSKLSAVLDVVGKLLLKMEKFKAVRSVVVANTSTEGANEASQVSVTEKEIILHPLAVQKWEDLPKTLEELGLDRSNFGYETIKLRYENWRADELLKYIIPEDQEAQTSFSRVGHIIHVNLRDHLLPYKSLIGQILLEKTVGCRTVVNKTKNIDNTYRNFQFELLCGEPDFQVEVKECGVLFEFDFSKVYWNPRLSTEHERIVELLEKGDVFYDVFAGVGPFSVPAARKKKCAVFANDLNPESYKWLEKNVKLNKCSELVKTFNKDGRQFILEDVRKDLSLRWSDKSTKNYKIHVAMNLPAMAVEFLDAFSGLLVDEKHVEKSQRIYPLIHVYSFAKGENSNEEVKLLVQEHIGHSLENILAGVYFVRNVAPGKDMYRVSFYLNDQILCGSAKKRNLSIENNDYHDMVKKKAIDDSITISC